MPNSKAATCYDVCNTALPGGTFVRFVTDKGEFTKYFRCMDFVDVVLDHARKDKETQRALDAKDTTFITCSIGMTPYWKKCKDGKMRLVFDIEATSINTAMRVLSNECRDVFYGPTEE